MSEFSPIEWTDATWNPLLGCDKCSAGCKFCYAIRTAWRLMHNPNPTIAAAYAGLVEQRPDGSLNWTGKINLLPERLGEPRSWRSPRRIFVNSQSDLFHDAVPDEFIDQVFAAMISCPQHTFQVLTKRAKRMREYMIAAEERVERAGIDLAESMGWCHAHEDTPWPPPHVWLGVSVEDQRAADERVFHLIETPAAVRFLSCEPLLGPLNLVQSYRDPDPEALGWKNPLTGYGMCDGMNEPSHSNQIDWVICGGESGPGARPMHPAWARSLRDQCAGAGVPFLFKQWGEWLPFKMGDAYMKQSHLTADVVKNGPGATGWPIYRVGKKAAGRLLDGREHNEFPPALQLVAS